MLGQRIITIGLRGGAPLLLEIKVSIELRRDRRMNEKASQKFNTLRELWPISLKVC